MILLTSVSDILRIVTGSAVATITVHSSYVDNASGTITPGRTNANITTAATTTIVAAPGASTQRNVKTVIVTNNNASTSCQVTVQHFDGTTSTDLMGVTLLPGENMHLLDSGEWQHHDAQGALYLPSVSRVPPMAPTGVIAETFDRQLATTNGSVGASGTLFLQAIYLYAGQTVANISMFAGGAAATTSNLFFALYDLNRNLLAQSANQGAYTWAINTKKTLAMTTPYKVTASGIYYIGVLQVATTISTLYGTAATANAVVISDAPILHGNSTTALTTALPNPAAAITAGNPSLYASVS